jgi:hypothetical protein
LSGQIIALIRPFGGRYVDAQVGLLALAIVVVACSCGCGNSGLVSVSGKVLYEGVPLENGRITFLAPGSRQASGEIRSGIIENVTTKSENDGLLPGEYRVSITSYSQDEKHRNMMVPPSLIPVRYGDLARSGLLAKISGDRKNELLFELTKE